MRFLRRLGGAITLLLSAVAIICCVAGILSIWIFYQRVSEKVQTISVRLDDGLERASTATQNTQRALEKARAAVANVDKESADVGGGGEKGRRASRALRTVIQQQAGPNLDDLGGRLATLSDVAAAVSSLLQSFQDVSSERSLRVNPEQLKRRADEAQKLSATLRRLEETIGDGDREGSGQEVTVTTSSVDRVLKLCQTSVDDWQSDVDGVRADLERVKAQTLRWMLCGAITLTFLLGWVALGQISLFGRALRWCKGA
jgi:hypothetical protein